jgi:hypothetical protein
MRGGFALFENLYFRKEICAHVRRRFVYEPWGVRTGAESYKIKGLLM